jgi:CDP-diacylglycerol--glycerol-3-phosphate 3-phosphatidyltransferase
MNLPNKLTILRFFLTGLFLAVIFSGVRFHESIALVLFAMAGITDHLDGRIARSRNLITNFGKLMDPLADKIMTCSAFIAFVGLHLVPAWMVVVIVARELAITGLRTLAASKNLILAAERFGKHKTVSQIVAILAILVFLSFREWGSPGVAVFGTEVAGHPWIFWLAKFSMWVAVVLTIYSGCAYLWRNREVYLSDM